jgi:hypothetical protein
MNTADFISKELILADVLPSLNDVELRNGISKGRYVQFIQMALEDLAQDSYFDKKTIDLPFPASTLSMPIPQDVFNIMYIYLWNGACCSPSSSQKVWWKRNYNNKGGNGQGYTADMKDVASTTWDPFIGEFYSLETVYYANIQEGKIMFSQSCSGFGFVRFVCNGFGGLIGDEPNIPRFFRRAITDYVRMKFYQEMSGKEPRVYRVMYEEAKQDLYNEQNGSWKRARIMVSQMNSFEKKSMEEYYSFINS